MRTRSVVMAAIAALLNTEQRFIEILEGKGEITARLLEADEQAEYNAIDGKLQKLNEELRAIDELAAKKKRQAERQAPKATPKATPEQKLSKSVNVMRGIQTLMAGKQLEGAELEAAQEAEKELRDAGGMSFSGPGLKLPSFMVDGRSNQERATITSTTAAPAIAKDIDSFEPALRPKLWMEDLGVRVLRNLSGNIKIPVGDAIATATYKAETAAADKTEPTMVQKDFAPKRLVAYSEFSTQSLQQSSIDVQNWVLSELGNAAKRKTQYVAINGSGIGDIPLGLLGTTGVGTHATTGNVTRDDLIELKRLVRIEDADDATLAWLTNSNVQSFLEKEKLDTGSGQFVWNTATPEMLHAHRAKVSNLVPSDLGTGSDRNALIFGDWNKLTVGYWGGINIIINPYIKDINGLVRISIEQFNNMIVTQPKAFAAAVDINA